MLLLLMSLAPEAHALRPVAVKNNKALIDLEGESLKVGDRLRARGDDGKTKALLEVRQVKGGRAVADITKGRMALGYTLSPAGGRSDGAPGRRGGKERSGWGFTAGLANNAMNVKLTSGTVALTGNSYNLSGFYETVVDGNFSTRIFLSYETLQAKATSSVCANSECKVDISYLGLETLVRYSFLRTKTVETWVGVGLGFLFAMGKESNILDTGKISTNQTIVGSLGMDYRLGRDSFIPLQFDYAMFPDNATSSAKQMILRFGYGWSF